jgi:hypothetical protein
MKSIGNIYLVWRKGRGYSRIVIGVIKRNTAENITFQYIAKGIEQAKIEGFNGYTDFPDFNKVYKENVIDIFGQRLTRMERIFKNIMIFGI